MRLFTLFLILTFMSGIIITSPAQAASDDECGVWLCLPAGFPGGCSGPHKAFLNRIKKGKNPLVNLSGCGGGGASADMIERGRKEYEDCPTGYSSTAVYEPRHDDSDTVKKKTGQMCINSRISRKDCASLGYKWGLGTSDEGIRRDEKCYFFSPKRAKPNYVTIKYSDPAYSATGENPATYWYSDAEM